jgi:hypothetical protein
MHDYRLEVLGRWPGDGVALADRVSEHAEHELVRRADVAPLVRQAASDQQQVVPWAVFGGDSAGKRSKRFAAAERGRGRAGGPDLSRRAIDVDLT